MKTTILTIATAIMFIAAKGQDSGAHVYEMQELKGPGYLVLNNGDTLNGELTYTPHKNERIWLLSNPTDKNRQEYNPGQVKNFKFTQLNRLFESQQENSGDKVKDSAFYERVNAAQLKFGVYKQFNSTGKIVGGKLEGWETIYVSIGGHLGITNIGSKTLRPLNEKLSTYLVDCADLQQKVSSEQDGYKMPMMMSMDKKVGVLLKIGEEYEGCGK